MKPLFASLAKDVKYHSANEPAGNYGCSVALPYKNSAGEGHASNDEEADKEPLVPTSGGAVLSSKLSGDTYATYTDFNMWREPWSSFITLDQKADITPRLF